MYQTELSWIQKLHDVLGGPFLNQFFIYWNYIDSFGFALILVASLMYLFNRKEGTALLFLFIISAVVNFLLKHYFHMPRPCQIDPSIGLICLESYGFPSGAAQTGTIIAGAALAKCRKMSIKILAVIFALFLYFSRVYLGVHFPTDILGGFIVGIGLVALYLELFPLVEKHWDKFAFCLSTLFFILGGEKMLEEAAIVLGIGLGLLLFKIKPIRYPKILTLIIALAGSLSLLYFGKKQQSMHLFLSALAGLWYIYLGPLVSSFFSRGSKIEN